MPADRFQTAAVKAVQGPADLFQERTEPAGLQRGADPRGKRRKLKTAADPLFERTDSVKKALL